MLAAVLVAAAPALAQVSEGFSERRITSGTASPKTEVKNTGNNANLCPTSQQAAQTGNVANEQGATQYQTKTDDIDFSGSEITLEPSTTAECTQTIELPAAAGPKAEAKAATAEAKGGGGSAPSGGGGGGAGGGGQLPATGGMAGTASLLGLGAGALLVSGGLLVRRIIR
jgi:LPXTG-motif cell wall-anchored protein